MKVKRIINGIITATVLAASCLPMGANAAGVADLDGDGRINMADCIRIYNYLAGGTAPTDATTYDISGNGIVSRLDATLLQLYITQIWNGEV